jgi:hypothetical protein
MIVLSEKVQFTVPLPCALYTAVSVTGPGGRPVSSDAALARCNALPPFCPARTNAFAADAGAPLMEYDISHDVEPELATTPLVTET